MSSYKDLDIYKMGLELFYTIHPISLQLPKHELYELGSQLRRSSESIVSNIVEGYGRKRYKADFIKFLTYSYSSCLETMNHIEKINYLYPNKIQSDKEIIENYDKLGAKIFSFIKYVEQQWKT